MNRRQMLLGCLLFGAQGLINAQNRPAQASGAGKDSLSPRALQAVRVTANRRVFADTAGTPVQVIRGAALERLNSFAVADAVRYFSGVQLKDYGGVGGLKTINVRSLGSNHTAVFYDGVQMGNAQNGQVDLGKFSLDNIAELALYDGQKSTIFQPAAGYASGNSLYLSSKQPSFSPGEKSREKLSFKTGSFGLVNPSLFWQYKLGDRVAGTISTELTNANGRYKFRYTNGVYDTSAYRNNGDINAQRIEAGLTGSSRESNDSDSTGSDNTGSDSNSRDSSRRDSSRREYTSRDGSSWHVKLYYYNSGRGLPGAIVANNFNYDQRLWNRDLFLQGNYQKDIRGYSIMVNGKVAYDHTRYLDPDYVTTTGFLDNRYSERQAYFSVAQLYRLKPWWNISLSNDYLYDAMDANLYHFAYPTRNTFLNALATELHFPRWNMQASLLSTSVGDKVRDYAAPGNKQEFTPSLILSWKPFATSDLRVRGFYKSIFRMPTFNDLYYTFIGNTFLQPEFAHQLDLGVTWHKALPAGLLTDIALQCDGYANSITDKIVAVPGANLFRWTMMNLGKVRVRGLEASVRTGWKLSHELFVHADLNYTYEQSLDITPGGDNYGQQIPYTPLNSGTLLAGLDWRRINLNYSFIYTGYRYDQAANIPANYLQPWYTHDLGLQYSASLRRHQLKGSMEVNNLFNQYYDVIANFPMPGRSYRFSLQFGW